MRGPPGAKASGRACVALSYSWNSPLGVRGAFLPQTSLDAQRPHVDLPLTRLNMHATGAAVCVCGHVGGRKIWTASDFAHASILRVLFRTRAGPIRAGRVRLCTRGLTACAKSDTQRPIRAIARPFVHTGRPDVCKVGREAGHTALYLSVCAHGTPKRVQSRTMPAVVYQGLAAHKNKSFDVADEFMHFPMSQ